MKIDQLMKLIRGKILEFYNQIEGCSMVKARLMGRDSF